MRRDDIYEEGREDNGDVDVPVTLLQRGRPPQDVIARMPHAAAERMENGGGDDVED